MSKIKWILFLFLFGILIYTRFNNLAWGLPYPMHPDERNMANAIQQLKCELRITNYELRINECMNPHFFAYGQFPLYLGYGIVMIHKFFDGDLGRPISFEETVISLRLISAFASVLNVLILLKLVQLIISKHQFPIFRQAQDKFSKQISNFKFKILNLFIFIFSPFFIQFSHFGTTESLLMLLFSIIVYLSLKYLKENFPSSNPSTTSTSFSINSLGTSFYFLTAVFSGMAIATKVSSLIFLLIPIATIIEKFSPSSLRRPSLTHRIRIGFIVVNFVVLTLIVSLIFSPHNFISFEQFLGSLKYESDVALGAYRAFYTRQFVMTDPIIFQFFKIFPYTLGWPLFVFFLLGFIFLPHKREFNLIRLAILSGFLPNAFLYAKWTRFVSPIFPLMVVIAVLFLEFSIFNFQFLFKSKYFIKLLLIIFSIFMIIPGVSHLSIYQNPDVRFTASDWIYKNIPSESYILSETANVVDAPFSTSNFQHPTANYNYISFNFYDLDENPLLQLQLKEHLARADYIFIPSRRIFANHYCPGLSSFRGSEITKKSSTDLIGTHLRFARFLADARNDKENVARNDAKEEKCQYLRKKYPLLNDYYDKLFSGELGFEKVAEFNSFPKIELFGKTILDFPDEQGEETWTVFDHPVFRIYRKISNISKLRATRGFDEAGF